MYLFVKTVRYIYFDENYEREEQVVKKKRAPKIQIEKARGRSCMLCRLPTGLGTWDSGTYTRIARPVALLKMLRSTVAGKRERCRSIRCSRDRQRNRDRARDAYMLSFPQVWPGLPCTPLGFFLIVRMSSPGTPNSKNSKF